MGKTNERHRPKNCTLLYQIRKNAPACVQVDQERIGEDAMRVARVLNWDLFRSVQIEGRKGQFGRIKRENQGETKPTWI